MSQEIERKFRIASQAYKKEKNGILYRQGYLSSDPHRCVRVRTVGDRGYLTIKGITHGCTRDEYEYEIPIEEASQLLNKLCLKPLIEKYRYRIPYDGLTWEVDEFLGDNAGLVIAEVELPSEDYPLSIPDWVAEEVTGDARYYNANLISHPFRLWDK